MSKPVLIVLRGNSGCGKTYLAKKIQNYYGTKNSFLIQQDIIRRNILHADDHVGNPSIKLMAKMLEFGRQNYHITILEGILRKDVYSEMLMKAINEFDGNVLFFYLDISFEQTVKNNSKKKVSFTPEQLRSWWREKDYFSKHDIIVRKNHNDDTDQIILKKVAKLMIDNGY